MEAVFYLAYLSCGARAALFSVAAAYLLRLPREEGRLRHVLRIPFRLTLFNIFTIRIASAFSFAFPLPS